MSDAHSIEAVTATLLDHIESGLRREGTDSVVVAAAPDAVTAPGAAHIALYLYQVEPQAAAGETARPAGWVLRYLLVPRAADDPTAYRLLGAALRVLHEHHPPFEGHGIGVAARPLGEAGMRALWSALGSPYRLSVAFEVHGVHLTGTATPLPYPAPGAHPAHREPLAAGPYPGAGAQPPVLLSAITAGLRPAARLGEVVELRGRHLCAPAVVRLEHRLLPDPVELAVHDLDATTARFTVPDTPDDLPAGVWLVSLRCAEPQPRTSNDVALAIAPRITTPLPLNVARDGAGTALVRLSCEPPARAGQSVFLILGDLPVPAEPPGSGSEAGMRFRLLHARPRDYPVRLRVDGVDSLNGVAGGAASRGQDGWITVT